MEKELKPLLEESSDSSAPEISLQAHELAKRLQNNTSETIMPEPPPQPLRTASVSDVMLQQALRVKHLQMKTIEESNALRGMIMAMNPNRQIEIDLDRLILQLQDEVAALDAAVAQNRLQQEVEDAVAAYDVSGVGDGDDGA